MRLKNQNPYISCLILCESRRSRIPRQQQLATVRHTSYPSQFLIACMPPRHAKQQIMKFECDGAWRKVGYSQWFLIRFNDKWKKNDIQWWAIPPSFESPGIYQSPSRRHPAHLKWFLDQGLRSVVIQIPMLAGVCTCDVFSPQCLAVKKNPTLNSHLGDNPAHNLPDFILRQLFHSLRALMVCHVPLEGAKPQESVVLSCAAITSSLKKSSSWKLHPCRRRLNEHILLDPTSPEN